ncbi:DUF7144 family membrane protein [Actinomadura gamaensis]|uniref:DUF7144 domain-containing protein n=1 Tax=Actinomadura gamaensis TaxID=1763541 RepID=A0ABV9TZU9_9ACTN
MTDQQVGRASSDPGRWAVGAAVFGAVMMIIGGGFQALEGFVAVVRHAFYVPSSHYAFATDATGWGWVHLIVGLVVMVAGFVALTGSLWARIVGIVMLFASALINFMFIPYYPVWALLIIGADLLAIWGLCLYSRDVAERHSERY